MPTIRKIFFVLLLSTLVGNSTAGLFGGPSEWVEKRIGWAKKALENSNGPLFVEQILEMSNESGGEPYAKSFIEESQLAQELLVNTLNAKISRFTEPEEAIGTAKNISRLEKVGCLKENVGLEMRVRLDQRVAQSSKDGTVPFTLLHRGGELNVLSQQALLPDLMRNTLSGLQNPASKNIQQAALAVLNVLNSQTKDSPIYAQVQSRLPYLALNESELKLFEENFPEIVSKKQTGGSVTVPQHIWGGLSSEQRATLSQRYIVNVLSSQNYGTILDVQTLNESTPGSNAGSRLGSAYGSAAYVDNAFKGSPRNWNYSATDQLTAGLVGGVVGSLLDKKAETRYRIRYTVKTGAGTTKYVYESGDSSLRHSTGLCMSIEPLQPIETEICDISKDQFLTKFAADINPSLDVYCKFATVPVPVKLPKSVCESAGGAVLK